MLFKFDDFFIEGQAVLHKQIQGQTSVKSITLLCWP